MALKDDDYREILKDMRNSLRHAGLGGIDERIISELHGSQGPFYDLVYYLKLLIDEIALGGDEQIKNVLRRVRSSVETDSGHLIDGIEIQLSPEESDRYRTNKLVFGPDPALQEIVTDLRSVIEEIKEDHYNEANPDRGFKR
ncbi:MAG: hypothetical protein FIB08_14835 [Candidatus Methanoperedens sp.]|nr:hypothetical protein [Candidatus Methanoperedens sp.]